MKKIISFFSLAVVAFSAMAQYPAVSIPGSETRKITSAIVTGQEYELQILLAGGYKNSYKKSPVVCFSASDKYILHAAGASRSYSTAEFF